MKNIVIILLILIVIVLGYVLYFRKSDNGNTYINPAPIMQQPGPQNGLPTPSQTLQPNEPSDLQDQDVAVPENGEINVDNPESTENNELENRSSVEAIIKDFSFNPGEIRIQAGTTVIWTNQDNASHTVTADDGNFDSGLIPAGEAYEFAFTTPGTFSYHCTVHPDMKGVIVVE